MSFIYPFTQNFEEIEVSEDHLHMFISFPEIFEQTERKQKLLIKLLDLYSGKYVIKYHLNLMEARNEMEEDYDMLRPSQIDLYKRICKLCVYIDENYTR